MGIFGAIKGALDKFVDYDARKMAADEKYRKAPSGKMVLKDEYMIGGAKYKGPNDDSDIKAAKNKILLKKRKQIGSSGTW